MQRPASPLLEPGADSGGALVLEGTAVGRQLSALLLEPCFGCVITADSSTAALGALEETVLGDVVGALQKMAPQLIDELEQTAQGRDFAAAARARHTLRSAALQVRAAALTELPKLAESEARSGCDVRARAESRAQEFQRALPKLAGKSA